MSLASSIASVGVDVGMHLYVRGYNPVQNLMLARPWGWEVGTILEEVLKLNGALLWLAYFWLTVLVGLDRRRAQGPP